MANDDAALSARVRWARLRFQILVISVGRMHLVDDQQLPQERGCAEVRVPNAE